MKSIFWKIFLAFWLANMLIISVGNLIVNHELSKKFLEVEVEQRINRVVERIILHRESGVEDRRLQERRRHHPRLKRMQVFDLGSGEIIFGPPELPPNVAVYSWEISSDSGNQYQVRVPRPPGSIVPSLSRHSPARLALVLLVTGLFSYLLTRIITRPLKRLESHIDRLGDGELNVRLDQKLTSRRDEFGTLANTVNNMADRIQALLESRQQLLHDVSHELRAPLARMQVANELAREKFQKHDPDSREFERVDQECDNLNNLIDEILTLARMAAGKDLESAESCVLGELLQQVIDDAIYRYQGREVQLTGEAVLSHAVQLRVGLLERALKNVIENALKYSPQNTPIKVCLNQTPNKATFIVEDNGPGLPDGDLPKIFTPFFRSKNIPGSTGYGLGLHIAKKSVQALPGTIEASRAEGGGLKITISLPIA